MMHGITVFKTLHFRLSTRKRQTGVKTKAKELDYTLFFFYKNVVFPAQAEYSYFSADFRLKISLRSKRFLTRFV